MRPVLAPLWLFGLALAGGPTAASAQAAESPTANRFALICASSVGFSNLDLSACAYYGAGEEPSKTFLSMEALIANTLSGGRVASMIVQAGFTEGVAVPYVPLNVDPCDAFLSSGGDGCSTTSGPAGLGVFGLDSTNDVLTDEQEALLGCGPFWGTDCEADGIDLSNAEASVLMQSWPEFDETDPEMRRLPGARGPIDLGYDPSVDGCTDPSADAQCSGAVPLAFQSEMAALSWNFLMTLIALDADFDPTQPTSDEPGQCSFAQPQYCSAVIAFFAPEPQPALGALAAVGAVASLRRRRARR